MKNINRNTKIMAAVLCSLVAFSSVAAERQVVKQPARATAKPDLIVYYVNSYYTENNKIKVTVRNNGNAKSGSNVLTVNVGGMVGQASIPALDPNHASEREVSFSKALTQGEAMRVFVDAKKHVDESNENNNTKTHTY